MKQVKSTMKKCLLAFAFLLVFGAMLMTGSVEAKAKEVKLHPFLVSVGQGETGKDGVYTIGKWGFQDDKGNIVIEPIYESVGDFSEGLCAVQTEEEGFYINTKGEKVISFEDSTWPAIGGMFKDGTAVVQIWKNEYAYEQILIDKTGKVIIKADAMTGRSIKESGEKGFVLYSRDASDAYTVYNVKGKKVLKGKTDSYIEINGDTIWKWNGKKYDIYNWSGKKTGSTKNDSREGYISDKGKVLINEKKYDYAGNFIDGVALVGKSGKYSLINEKGKVIKNLPKVYRVERITSGLILLEKKDGSLALMNTKGKYVFKFGKASSFTGFTWANDNSEYVKFIQKGKLGVLSGETGKVIVPAEYDKEKNTIIGMDTTESYREIIMMDSNGRMVMYDFDGIKIGSYKGDLSRPSL